MGKDLAAAVTDDNIITIVVTIIADSVLASSVSAVPPSSLGIL